MRDGRKLRDQLLEINRLRKSGGAEQADYEAGWLVVHARFFVLEQRSPRGYKLSKESRIINVNAMMRLPNVIFSGGAVGKPPQTTRSGLCILDEDMYNLLLESV